MALTSSLESLLTSLRTSVFNATRHVPEVGGSGGRQQLVGPGSAYASCSSSVNVAVEPREEQAADCQQNDDRRQRTPANRRHHGVEI